MNGFDQFASGYAPLARGIEHRPLTGFDGLPFVHNPVMGTMAAFLTPTAQSWMNGVGMSPMGLTGRNVSHVMRNMRYTEHQNQILREMAQQDRESVIRTLKGAASLANKDWTEERAQAAGTFADAFANVGPGVAQMSPDAIDAITGGTSAMGLAMGVTKGARYRADPMTGLPGTGTESATALSKGLHAMYFEGGKFDRAKNLGFSSSQIGALFDELSRRGMVAGIGSPEEAALGGISMLERNDATRFKNTLTEQLGAARANELTGAGGDVTSRMTAAELQKVAGSAEGSDSIRAFDVTRVKQSIDKYAKLTAAMRDIFGDAGRPDAPMAELIQGLEALTNGSLQQMGAGQSEMLVRTMYNAAKGAGVGLEGLVMVQQTMAQSAAQMGLHGAAVPLMTRETLLALGAAQQTGIGGLEQWGALNAEQLGQSMGNRYGSAMKSELANRLGATANLDKRLKQIGGAGFGADTNIGRMLAALEQKRTSFEFVGADGKTVTRDILEFAGRGNRQEFVAELNSSSGGRFNERELDRQERNRFANTQAIVEREYGDQVSRMQPYEEVRDNLAPKIAADLRTRLKERGMSDADANAKRKELRALSGRIGTHILTSTDGDEDKIKAITGMLRDSGLYAGASEEDLREIAAEQLNSVDLGLIGAYGDEAVNGSRNRVAISQQNSDQLRSGIEARRMQDAIDARRDQALTGIGQNRSMVERLVQAVGKQGDKPADPQALRRVLAEMIGGTDSREIAAALQAPLVGFQAAREEFDRLSKQMADLGQLEPILPTDSAEEKARKEAQNDRRRTARKGYDQSSAQLTNAQKALQTEMRRHTGVAQLLDAADGTKGKGVFGRTVDGQLVPDADGDGGITSLDFEAWDKANRADPSRDKPPADSSASTGDGKREGPLEIAIATLQIHRDGGATLSANGSGRGAVPTGVS